ncbi:MAG: transposase [Opitutae bacterium]|nr:transposase [Opitutae bacterium]
MQEYPRRLQHNTPAWVKDGALFHIRVRASEEQKRSLIDAALGRELLAAAQRYHELSRWWCELFLLMPDHWHALLLFPREQGMASTMRDWKRGTARFQGVLWQENFFDHRIRTKKSGEEKWRYIRRNPAAKGLCAREGDWPWWWSGALDEGGTH